jgi:hypothetical protein
MVPGTLSPVVKLPGREADHSPPTTVKAKKGEAIPLLPHIPHVFKAKSLTN